jgi:prophage regulatory protein
MIEPDSLSIGKIQPTRLIRLPEVMSRVGLKRSAIYQRMGEGRFPKSRSLGSKCAVWPDSGINDWIASVAEGRFGDRWGVDAQSRQKA